MDSSYDVLIIGGGLSGLAAGIRLAYYQKKVCIVEKHTLLGGLNSYYFKNGHYFDVGLHAMTNYIDSSSSRKLPLAKLLRQLRIPLELFELRPQKFSRIQFPNTILDFTNDFKHLKSEISDKFPQEIDNFNKLCKTIDNFNEVSLNTTFQSAKERVSSFIKNPLLVDMIFCPLMFYGSSLENDMNFAQFCIMFKSIFYEGFCRPEYGMKKIIKLLTNRYLELGGELFKNCEVRKIHTSSGKLNSVELANNNIVKTSKVMSSIGYIETLQLFDKPQENLTKLKTGQMSFVESILLTKNDIFSKDTENYPAITFYNLAEKFSYKKPNYPVDFNSGVICIPGQFNYKEIKKNNVLRITNIANYQKWNEFSKANYKKAKEETLEKQKSIVSDKIISGFSEKVDFTDTFTPLTIKRYTGHINGAVYGSQEKIRNGLTPIENVYICGTDQGFLGIVGSMLSGVSMVNYHIFK